MSPQADRIVIGFDGSPDGHRALTWGADLASHSHTELQVVVARGDLYRLSDWADEWTRDVAEEWGEEAKKALKAFDLPNRSIEIRDGLPAEVLIQASSGVSVLVVGSRGKDVIAGLLHGSVTQHVSRHAACPVVVVRPVYDERSKRVVVGLDGSPQSIAALDFAAAYAERYGMEMTGIHCWLPWDRTAGGPHRAPAAAALRYLTDNAEHILSEAAERVHHSHPGVPLLTTAQRRSPTQALTEASHDAALVVVGSTGRDAFDRLLLGSVSSTLVRDAQCPVAVVR